MSLPHCLSVNLRPNCVGKKSIPPLFDYSLLYRKKQKGYGKNSLWAPWLPDQEALVLVLALPPTSCVALSKMPAPSVSTSAKWTSYTKQSKVTRSCSINPIALHGSVGRSVCGCCFVLIIDISALLLVYQHFKNKHEGLSNHISVVWWHPNAVMTWGEPKSQYLGQTKNLLGFSATKPLPSWDSRRNRTQDVTSHPLSTDYS